MLCTEAFVVSRVHLIRSERELAALVAAVRQELLDVMASLGRAARYRPGERHDHIASHGRSGRARKRWRRTGSRVDQDAGRDGWPAFGTARSAGVGTRAGRAATGRRRRRVMMGAPSGSLPIGTYPCGWSLSGHSAEPAMPLHHVVLRTFLASPEHHLDSDQLLVHLDSRRAQADSDCAQSRQARQQIV